MLLIGMAVPITIQAQEADVPYVTDFFAPETASGPVTYRTGVPMTFYVQLSSEISTLRSDMELTIRMDNPRAGTSNTYTFEALVGDGYQRSRFQFRIPVETHHHDADGIEIIGIALDPKTPGGTVPTINANLDSFLGNNRTEFPNGPGSSDRISIRLNPAVPFLRTITVETEEPSIFDAIHDTGTSDNIHQYGFDEYVLIEIQFSGNVQLNCPTSITNRNQCLVLNLEVERITDIANITNTNIPTSKQMIRLPLVSPSGSFAPTSTYRFGYYVGENDFDVNGIGLGDDALQLASGASLVQAGQADTNIYIGLEGHVADTEAGSFIKGAQYRVDGFTPYVTDFQVTPRPRFNNTFYKGEEIVFVLSMSHRIHTGSSGDYGTYSRPHVRFTLGNSARRANLYLIEGGGDVLHLRYTVQESDSDIDGLSLVDGRLAGCAIRNLSTTAIPGNCGTHYESAKPIAARLIEGSNLDDYNVRGELPTLTISSAATVTEDETEFPFAISLSHPSLVAFRGTLRVQARAYVPAGNTHPLAKRPDTGNFYLASERRNSFKQLRVDIEPGETEFAFVLEILEDTLVEGDESVYISFDLDETLVGNPPANVHEDNRVRFDHTANTVISTTDQTEDPNGSAAVHRFTIVDDDITVRGLSLTVTPDTIVESAPDRDQFATITVAWVGGTLPTAQTISVDFEGSGEDHVVGYAITAEDGSTPVTSPFDLTIAADQPSVARRLKITPVDDAFRGHDETITFATTYQDFAERTATVTLEEDDALLAWVHCATSTEVLETPAKVAGLWGTTIRQQRCITFNRGHGDSLFQASFLETKAAGERSTIEFTVSVTPSPHTIEVGYQTNTADPSPGDSTIATPNEDYEFVAGQQLTINAGETHATFTVTILEDERSEYHSEVFLVHLRYLHIASSNPHGERIWWRARRDNKVSSTFPTGLSYGSRDFYFPITIHDDDEATVTVDPEELTLDLGGEGQYTMSLDARPTQPVTITPTSGNDELATVSDSLTFTSDDWNTPQSVTVTMSTTYADDDTADDTVTITHAQESEDPYWQGDYRRDIPSVSAIARDPDVPGVTITKNVDETGDLVVLEPDIATIGDTDDGSADLWDTYEVKLDYLPDANVTLTQVASDPSAARGSFLVFTPENWKTPQTATVFAVRDADVDDETVEITHEVTSTGNYGDGVLIRYNLHPPPTPATPLTAWTYVVRDARHHTLSINAPTVAEDAAGEPVDVVFQVTVAPPIPDARLTLQYQGIYSAIALEAAEESFDVSAPDPGSSHYATPGVDFNGLSGDTMIVPAGDASETLTISTRADNRDEMDEAVFLLLDILGARSDAALSSAGSYYEGRRQAVRVNFSRTGKGEDITYGIIEDNDEAPTAINLSASHKSIGESDGPTEVTIAATLVGGTTFDAPRTLEVTVAGGDTGGDVVDFTLNHVPPSGSDSSPAPDTESPFDFVIIDGAAAATFILTITPEDDNLHEANEVITLEVADNNANAPPLSPSTFMVTLADDDVVGVTVPSATLTVPENGEQTYELVLDTQPRHPVTITPASSNTDQATVSGALTFETSGWDTAQTITVTGIDDADTLDHAPSVTHAVVSGDGDYHGLTIAATSTKVVDDDVPVLSVTMPSGEEADATLTFTVSIPAADDQDVAVEYEVRDGTATAGADYTAVAPDTLTIATGATSAEVPVAISEDTRYEGAEETFTLHLSNPSNASLPEGKADYPGTITDDDAKPGIALSVSDDEIGEADGATKVTITAALTGGTTFDAPRTVAVSLSGSGDAGAVDFVATSPADIIIGAGESSTTTIVTLTPIADNDDEANEVVTVSGADRHASDAATVQSASITIVDDDAVGITVSTSTLRVAEGGMDTYTIVLTSAPTPAGSTVAITATSAKTSVATVSAAISFDDSNWSEPQTVTVTGLEIGDADTLDSSSEITHTVAHAAANGDYADATAAAVTVTVADPDVPAISMANATTTEAGDAEIVFTVAIPAVDDQHVTMTYTTSAVEAADDYGPATAGVDYTAANGKLTIAAGEISETVAIDVGNDAYYEGQERFALQLLVPSNGTLPGGGSAHGIINDDETEPGGIILELNPTTATEGPNPIPVSVTARLDGGDPYAEDKVVRLSFSAAAAGTATVGYATPAAFDITLGAGERNSGGTDRFNLQTRDDDIGGQQTATLVVSGAVQGGPSVTGAELTIDDDDEAPTEIVLSTSAEVVSEAAGKVPLTVTATVRGDKRFTAAHTVTLSLGGTAEEGVDGDYVLGALPDIVIGAGAASGQASMTLTVRQDGYDEGSKETIIFTGTTEAASVAATTVTITDDDGAGVQFSDAILLVRSGSFSSYVVSLRSRPTHTVRVNLEVDGDADAITITPRNLQLAFPATEEHWDEGIVVRIDDANDADTHPDDLIIRHSLESSDARYAAIDLSRDDVSVFVADGDVPGLLVSVTDATEGAEDAKIQFEVDLTAADDMEARVSYATSDGTATAGEDYDATSGELVFEAGETSKTVTVNVLDDNLYEGAETMSLVLSAPVNAALPESGPSTSATIADDETAPTGIVLRLSSPSVAEDANQAARTLTVTAGITGGNPLAVPRTLTVTFSPSAGADDRSVVRYSTPANIELAIAAGTREAKAEFVLTPVDDAVGGQRDAIITVSVTEHGGLTVASTTLRVTDDDDAPTEIALAVSPDDLAEGGGEAALVVTAAVRGTTRFAAPRTVTLSLAGTATAGAGNDYTHAALPSLVIPAGAASGTASMTLTLRQDRFDEGDGETIVFGGTAGTASVGSATVALGDDDAAGVLVSAATSGVRVAAGGSAAYEVRLGSRPEHPVTVTFEVVSGDADAAAVTPMSGELVFPATENGWDDPMEVRITDADDDDTQADALTIGHDVQSDDARYAAIKPLDVAVTVADDDAPELSFSAAAPAVAERSGGSQLAFVVLLSPPDDEPVRVSYATRDVSATAGADYNAADGELVFEAGQTSKAVTVHVRDDAVHEGDETLMLVLSAPVNASLSGGGATLSTTGTIRDDEAASTGVALAVTPATLSEGGGAREVTVTATLTGGAPFAASRTITVSFAPPAADADKSVVRYGALSAVDVVITAGASSNIATVMVTPVNDNVGGQDPARIAVSGTNPDGLTVAPTTITVTNDDSLPGAVDLSLSTATLAEDSAATTVTVTATVDGATRFPTNRAVTLSLSGTATAGTGNDYTHGALPSLVIPAGAAGGEVELAITVREDSIDEGNGETIAVDGALDGISVRSAMIGIIDNDGAGVTVSSTTVTVTEGGAVATYGLELKSRPLHPVRISFDFIQPERAAGVASILNDPQQITFLQSEWNVPKSVRITAPHDDDTLPRTLAIDHGTAASDDLQYNGAAVQRVAVRVVDDDVPPLSVDVDDATEGATVGMMFVVSIPAADDENVTAAYATRDGTATAGEDYEQEQGQLTIEAGSTRTTVAVTLLGDDVYEGREALMLELSSLTNASLPGGASSASFEGAIDDDETASTGVALSVTPAAVSEGAGPTAVTVTATLTGGAPFAAERVVTVSFTEPAGADDHSVVRHLALDDVPVTIDAGKSAGTATVMLTPVADDVGGQSSAALTVSGEDSGGLAVVSATLAVTDDDDAPTGIALSVSPPSLSEGAGATSVAVTATVVGGKRFAAARTVTLSLSGTATGSGVDYGDIGQQRIAVAAGAASGTVTFGLEPEEDTVDEPDETILFGGSVDAPGIAVSGTTLTLTDNDTATVLVTPTAVPVAAGGVGAYAVSLQTRPTHPVMVDLTVAGDADAADIAPRQLVFPITDEWDDPRMVTITDSEDADTWIDALTIKHAVTSADDNYNGAAAASVTATVADADVPVLSVSVTGATEGAEDAAAVFVVDLAAADDQEARVSYATSNGTATAGEDYDAANGELVFAAGETSKTVTVTVHDDGVYEGDETLMLTLSGAVNASLPGDGPSFAATIADDETAPTGIALSVSRAIVAENAASAAWMVTVTATLQGANPSATAHTVSVSFSDPADPADKSVVRYADPADAEVIIAAGTMAVELEFELAPVDDDIGGQADAVISVTGTDAGGLPVTAATLTVTDDDDPPEGITLEVSPPALSEANTDRTAIMVTATVDGATRFPADLALTLSLAGTAVADADYTHDPLPSIAIAAGAATGTAELTITVIDDAVDEDDPETIVVSGTVAGASSATVTSARINLADNDGAGVTVSPGPITVPAGGADDYQISLRSRPVHPVTVDLMVAGDADAATIAPRQLVFPTTEEWDDPLTVTITDLDDADTLDDGFEITHAVTSADPNYDDASAAPVTATVADDDVPALSVSVTGAAEGAEDTAAVFVVDLAAVDDQEARVSHATSNGTATAGEDYDAASEELVFAPGETSKTVIVTVRDDGVYEGDETLMLTLSGAVNASLPGDGPSFTATITDDETAPTGIALSVSRATVAEDAVPAARMVTVTAMLQGANPSATAHTVSVSFSDPADPADKSVVRYADPADADLVIAAGTMDVELEFELAPVDDDIGGQADAVISVTGTDAGGLPVTAATLTVTDDDDPPGGITLGISPSALSEANTDRTTIMVTATVDGATRFPADLALTLSLVGTAAADADYAHDPLPSIAIAAGAATGTAELTLAVVDDAVDEDDPETIVLSGAVVGASSVTVAAARINLADNDGAGVTVSPGPIIVPAGGANDYQISLRSRPVHPVTVDLAVPSQDAATVAPTRLVFPAADAWDDPLPVTITDLDDADTLDDGFEITHAVTSADPNYDGATAVPVSATVFDADAPVVTVTEPRETEGEGAALEFEVGLPAADDQDSTVAFETRNGTATAGEDYTARSGTITIGAGNRSATVRIELIDDALFEGDETLLLVLTLPQAANAALPAGRTELVAIGTIVDSETATAELVLSASPGQIEEDAGATDVVVMVSIPDGGAPFDEPRTVRVSLSEPDPNNRAVVGHEAVEALEIIIPAGATEAAETLTLTPVNDDVSGQSSARIKVSGDAGAESESGGGVNEVPNNAAGNGPVVTPTVLTITDDDVTELSMPPPGIAQENADPGELTFEVTASKPSAVDIEVEFETADGTAVAGEDYLHATGTLTITAGNRSAVVRVTLHDDNLYEGDETVNLILRNPRNALLSGDVARLEATGIIGDDEAAALGITLSVDPPSMAEGAGEAAVVVTAGVAGNTPLARRSTIVLSLAGTARPTEDYEPVSIPVLVIEAGHSSGTATLMLTPVDDGVDEPDVETVEIGGSVIEDEGTGDLVVTPATLRIVDDDTAVLSAAAAPAYENAKPAQLVFDITLSSPSDRNVEVEFETRDVEQHAGDATAGDDYEKVSGRLTIVAGDQSETVRVNLYDDPYYEGPENLELALRNIVNAPFEGGGSTLVVVGTINDDEFDAAGVALAVQPPSLSEADGPTQITVTATLSGSAPFQDRRAITLTLSGTALTGADYEPPEPPPIVIAAGATSGVVTFTLTPMNDDLDEPDTETIIIDGTVDAGASELSVAPATLALRDDDQAGLVVTTPTLDTGGPASAPVSVMVSEGSTAVYSLALGSQPFSETEVELRSSHPDKATLQPTRLTFTAADWNQARQITITGTRDDDVLDDRATVTHASSSVGSGYPSLEVSIEVLVTDDDVPRLVAIEHATTPMREGVYGFTEEIRFVLTFTRPVRVEGRPRLRLTFDNEERFAEYQSGSFSTELTFAYVVRENDRADDGLRILVNPVRLDDGTAITDAEHADIDADTEWNEVIEIPVGVNGNMDPLLAAVAGDDFKVAEVTDADRASGAADAVVTLDGSDSASAEPERLGYAWAPSSSNTVRVSLENADAAVAHFTVPNLPQTTRLEFVLTVTNTRTNERDSDSVVVTIEAENEAPVADAGDDQTVQEGTPVTLDGSGSSDPEGLPLTFAWSIVGDQHEVEIKGADTARPTFTSPTKLRADAALVFELTVTDHAGLTHADRVTITTRAVNLNPIMKHALAAFGRSLGSSAVDALGERFDSSNRLSPVFGVGSRVPATNPVDNISMHWGTSAADAMATYSPGGLAPGPMWNEHHIGTPLMPGNDTLPLRNPMANGGFNLGVGKWWGGNKKEDENNQENGAETRAEHDASGDDPPEGDPEEPSTSRGDHYEDDYYEDDYYEDDYYEAEAAEQPDTGAKWMLWGRSDMRGFDGQPAQGLSLNGSMNANYVGIDRRLQDRGVVGVALSMAGGSMDYESGAINGEVDLNLRSLLPYGRWRLDRGMSVWGILGLGSGTAQIATDYGRRAEADLSMQMLAVGMHQALMTICGVDVSAKGDALRLTMDAQAASDADDLRDDLQASVSRLRLAVESRGVLVLSRTAQLRPSAELAVRIDGGDAETGFGMEMLGGMSYVDAQSGITAESRVRYLLMHASGTLREWGASMSMEWDPGAKGGLGLSLEPVWGRMGTDPSSRWRGDDPFDIGALGGPAHGDRQPLILNASLRYELYVSDWRMRPYATLDMNSTRRHRRTGLHFEALELERGEVKLDLFGEWGGDEHPFGYGLEARLRLSVY